MDISTLAERYGGVLTADALLIVREEEQRQCAECPDFQAVKRQRVDNHDHVDTSAANFSVPVHRAVLWSVSEFFASKFKNWSGNEDKPHITLLVPAGQLNIGKALVATIYDKVPTELSQQQLLQLLVLADSYGINKISSEAASTLKSIPLEQWQWETVLAVDQLSTAERCCQSLVAAAKARRMQLLGDLEVVWALEAEQQRQLLQKQLQPGKAAAKARAHKHTSTAERRPSRYRQWFSLPITSSSRDGDDMLQISAQAVEEAAAAAAHSTELPHELVLQLPLDSLVQLLQSDELKAESENTVHYTITRWLQQHPEVSSTEQLQRLASLVRLSHCTPNYFTMCVCRENGWLPPLVSAHELARQLSVARTTTVLP